MSPPRSFLDFLETCFTDLSNAFFRASGSFSITSVDFPSSLSWRTDSTSPSFTPAGSSHSGMGVTERPSTSIDAEPSSITSTIHVCVECLFMLASPSLGAAYNSILAHGMSYAPSPLSGSARPAPNKIARDLYAQRLWSHDLCLDGHDRSTAIPAAYAGYAGERLHRRSRHRGPDDCLLARARRTCRHRHRRRSDRRRGDRPHHRASHRRSRRSVLRDREDAR